MSATIERQNDGWVSPIQYSASHDLMHYLVPYEHFNIEPWDELHRIREWLQEQPSTVSTWEWKDTDTFGRAGSCKPRRRLFRRLLGAWALDVDRSRRGRFVNPYYNQLDRVEWTPDAPPMLYTLQTGLVGKYTVNDVAERLNVSRTTVQGYCQHRSIPWRELREYGKRRLGNTVLVTHEWTGRSIPDCARALDMPSRTLYDMVYDHATLDPIPERPSESGVGSGW